MNTLTRPGHVMAALEKKTPHASEQWNQAMCPTRSGPQCVLVSDGKCNFVCRTCGTGYFVDSVGAFHSFDWNGKYPWEA